MCLYRFYGNTHLGRDLRVFFLLRPAFDKYLTALRRQLLQHTVYLLFQKKGFLKGKRLLLVVFLACAGLNMVLLKHILFTDEIKAFMVYAPEQIGFGCCIDLDRFPLFPQVEKYALYHIFGFVAIFEQREGITMQRLVIICE